MHLNKFTEKAREAIAGTQTLAAKLDHQQIEVEPLLNVLLEQEKGLAPAILTKAGVNPESLVLRLQRELDKLPKVTGSNSNQYVSQRFNKLIAQAEDEAKKLKD